MDNWKKNIYLQLDKTILITSILADNIMNILYNFFVCQFTLHYIEAGHFISGLCQTQNVPKYNFPPPPVIESESNTQSYINQPHGLSARRDWPGDRPQLRPVQTGAVDHLPPGEDFPLLPTPHPGPSSNPHREDVETDEC